MAPYVGVRLNAEHGDQFDIDTLYKAWFGDVDGARGWAVTAGEVLDDSHTADGLDGARKRSRNFRAFTMSSLNGPAWLLPAVRYEQRYARFVAKYALNMAASMRLLQGYALDWNHQDHKDHKDWEEGYDREYLLFYEALTKWSPDKDRSFPPYATGDPIVYEWFLDLPEKYGELDPTNYLIAKNKWISEIGTNHAMYMGNHIGLLGAVCEKTNINGIVRRDCLKTEWYHPPAYPTYLFHNPLRTAETVIFDQPIERDIYDTVSGDTVSGDTVSGDTVSGDTVSGDTVSGQFLAREVRGPYTLQIDADQTFVLVLTPPGGHCRIEDTKLCVDDIVVDYRIAPQRE